MESLSYIKISSERVEEPIVKAAHILAIAYLAYANSDNLSQIHSC